MEPILCGDCGAAVPDAVRECVVCGADAGFPNVRAAARPAEVAALNERVTKQEEYAANKAYAATLMDFRHAADSAEAVLCAAVGRVSQLASSDNELFATFYEGVGGSARIPEQNEWDALRQSVDALLFPYFFQHLKFAALSLDGTGVAEYGGVCLQLRDAAIGRRATTFEENSVTFVKRHNLGPGKDVPRGYRATWDRRGAHAVAKLGHLIRTGMTTSDFATLLHGDSRAGEFIEVHIYGPLHRRAIASAHAKRPGRRADRVLLDSIGRKLNEVGATLVVE
jgi:hypothetical protein